MLVNMHKIIDIDYGRNHAQREYSLEYVHAIMNEYVKTGGDTFETDKVFIIHEDIGDENCEFHCINGGSGKDLTKAVESLLKQLASIYVRAVTYYDNPRINDLAKYVSFPTTVLQLNGGLDRTYEMSFDLRS